LSDCDDAKRPGSIDAACGADELDGDEGSCVLRFVFDAFWFVACGALGLG
jgi:hypothetical protein